MIFITINLISFGFYRELPFCMKRILTIVLLLFITIIIIGLIPFNKQVVVKINASYFNCYQQLGKAESWEKWNPDINKGVSNDSLLCKLNNTSKGFKLTIPNGYFDVKMQYSGNILVKRVINGNDFNYSYIIIPGANVLTTNVIATFKSSVIKYFILALEKDDLRKTAILDFKKYMEDTKSFYGYVITSALLKERKVIVNRKTVLKKQIYTETSALQNQLHNYILSKRLIQAGQVMVQYIPKAGDSIQITIGIPVNKKITTDNGFLYMQIPPTKVLLTDFKGKYSEKQKAFAAMGRYIQDRYLHGMSSPDEVFISNLPVSDDSEVEFRLMYPIL
jgi:effector-binding domain-containing protein